MLVTMPAICGSPDATRLRAEKLVRRAVLGVTVSVAAALVNVWPSMVTRT